MAGASDPSAGSALAWATDAAAECRALPMRGALAFAGSLAPRVFEVAARVDVVATEGWGRTLDLGHLIEKGVWYLDLG